MSAQKPPFDFDEQPPGQPNPYGQPPQNQTPPPYYGPAPTDPFGNPVSPYAYTVATPPPPPRTRFPTCLILLIVGLACCLPLFITAAIVASVGGVLGSSIGDIGDIGDFINEAITQIQGPPTEAIVGDPANFDPLVGLDQAQAFAGEGAQLAAVSARYIRSDGTMDLTADYNASTTYQFVRPIDPPENAPPVGTANNRGGQWYEPISIEAYRPGQMSTITTTGGGMSTRIQFINQGMRKNVGDPTTNPSYPPAPPMRCAFSALWDTALGEGAPADAVATIDYDSFGDSWEYDFNVSGWRSLTFDENCKLT